jgi:hypothetical protein
MLKSIVGNWGTDLHDDDYARAIAALGVLQARATHQHGWCNNDPNKLLQALLSEMEEGKRTQIWRGAWYSGGYDIKERDWATTIYTDAHALAQAWRLLLEGVKNRGSAPRTAVLSTSPKQSMPFPLDDLVYWLTRPAVGLAALLLATEPEFHRPMHPLLHWPVRIGVPLGSDSDHLWNDLQRNSPDWMGRLSQIYRVGEAREACDILLVPSGIAKQLANSSRLRLKATFIVCLDPPGNWREAASGAPERLRSQIDAAGVALIGSTDVSYTRGRSQSQIRTSAEACVPAPAIRFPRPRASRRR